jgi:hypothetical protein
VDGMLYNQKDLSTMRPGRQSLDLTMKNNKEKIYPIMMFESDNIFYKLTTMNDTIYTNSFHNEHIEDDRTTYSRNTLNRTQYSRDTHEGGKASQQDNNQKYEIKKHKLFGRQFLSMDTMFDALFLYSKNDSKYKLRVPLASQIDYKGFRIIAISQIPILASQGASLGFHDGKYQQDNTELKSAKTNVGEILNLKEGDVFQPGLTQQISNVPCNYFIKVYNF